MGTIQLVHSTYAATEDDSHCIGQKWTRFEVPNIQRCLVKYTIVIDLARDALENQKADYGRYYQLPIRFQQMDVSQIVSFITSVSYKTT